MFISDLVFNKNCLGYEIKIYSHYLHKYRYEIKNIYQKKIVDLEIIGFCENFTFQNDKLLIFGYNMYNNIELLQIINFD